MFDQFVPLSLENKQSACSSSSNSNNNNTSRLRAPYVIRYSNNLFEYLLARFFALYFSIHTIFICFIFFLFALCFFYIHFFVVGLCVQCSVFSLIFGVFIRSFAFSFHHNNSQANFRAFFRQFFSSSIFLLYIWFAWFVMNCLCVIRLFVCVHM